MMFFLTERVETLREAVAPDAGIILVHHTKKMNKKQVAEDPFQALSGASALRGFYTSGSSCTGRTRRTRAQARDRAAQRAGIAGHADRQAQWPVDRAEPDERTSRAQGGRRKLDAERVRKHDVILGILLDEAAEGRLYTTLQFAEKFENTGGLGGKDTIRDRISVLATKGYIKFVRDGSPFGLPHHHIAVRLPLCRGHGRALCRGGVRPRDRGNIPAACPRSPQHLQEPAYRCAAV